ncbi:hypothetical protein, partial [Acinetobacter indicus]|uniref:hypothetical protein n=1 Tax=Acinetobacter indicus TaxID=756892 RepID=UPI001C093E69
ALRIDSGMAEVCIPYMNAGFIDTIEIYRSNLDLVSKLPMVVRNILSCLGYGPKYVTALVTSTVMEQSDEDGVPTILPSFQLWEIHLTEGKRLVEPQHKNNHQKLWQEYYKEKVIRKATKIEFFKNVLEQLQSKKKEYYMLGDGRTFATTLKHQMSYENYNADERGWEYLLDVLDSFWKRENSELCFRPDTFEVWKKIADDGDKSLDQRLEDMKAQQEEAKIRQEAAQKIAAQDILGAIGLKPETSSMTTSTNN